MTPHRLTCAKHMVSGLLAGASHRFQTVIHNELPRTDIVCKADATWLQVLFASPVFVAMPLEAWDKALQQRAA